MQSTATLPQPSETTMNMNDVLAALEATSTPDLDMLASTAAAQERVLDEQTSSKTVVDDKKRHRLRKWFRTRLERVLQRFRQRPQGRRREGGLRTRLRLFFRLRPRPQTGFYGYPQAGAELGSPVTVTRAPYPSRVDLDIPAASDTPAVLIDDTPPPGPAPASTRVVKEPVVTPTSSTASRDEIRETRRRDQPRTDGLGDFNPPSYAAPLDDVAAPAASDTPALAPAPTRVDEEPVVAPTPSIESWGDICVPQTTWREEPRTDGSGDFELPSYASYAAPLDEVAASAKPESLPATVHPAAFIDNRRDLNIDDEAARWLWSAPPQNAPPSRTPTSRVVGASAKHRVELRSSEMLTQQRPISERQGSWSTFAHADYTVGPDWRSRSLGPHAAGSYAQRAQSHPVSAPPTKTPSNVSSGYSAPPPYSRAVESVGGYDFDYIRLHSSAAAPERNAPSKFSSHLHAAPAPSQDSKAKVPVTKRQGAWSPSECARYDEGLKLFPGGPWRAIADHIGTRTETQVRSKSQSVRAKRKRHEEREERCKKSHYPSSPYLSMSMHAAMSSDTVSAQTETEKLVAQANEEQQTSTAPEEKPSVSAQRKTARVDKLTSVQGPPTTVSVNSSSEDKLKNGEKDQGGESLRLHVIDDPSNSDLQIDIETDEWSLLELFRDSYDGTDDGLFLLEPLTEVELIK